MEQTFHRRSLPTDAIAFSSPEGRGLFSEALATEGMNGYFPLAEQFHTQSEPAFCGLGSLVVALNALSIDPGRTWKGPWRWFAEEMLDCCAPLADVRERGVDVDELACLARCNGADVEIHRGDASSLQTWRAALAMAASGEAVVVASYDRAAMGQTGSGHFSPIGGYHLHKDLALILDVARFKYPPHWVSAERLWLAMQGIDPATGQARGWLVIGRAERRGFDRSTCCNA
jgi:glutathione gamma-glutamylcysteinyltransferase